MTMAATGIPADVLIDRLETLSDRIEELAAAFETERLRRQRLEELLEDAMPLVRAGTDRLSSYLETLDDKGYLEFGKAGLGVVDEVVTNFSAEDVRQLGDNIVLILETVKEMTQPEVMALLHRMIEAVEKQRAAVDESVEPPTLWQLAKQARQPAVRRGLSRALDTLAAVSETPSTPAPQASTQDSSTGGT